MEEKLLNIEEVARYLNLSEKTVKQLVEKGDLPAYKIGGVILRFKREQIENYRKRRSSNLMAEKALSQERSTKVNFMPEDANKQRLWAGRNDLSKPSKISYTFLERLEDFLYYNDF